MKDFTSIILLLLATILNAQSDWNWPEGKKMYDMSREKQGYYKVLMGKNKYEEALNLLKWLYEHNANLNPSIYIDGIKCAGKIIESLENNSRIAKLQDSVLWMYDARISHFGNEAFVMDRKIFTAFKYHYKSPEKYDLLIALFEKAFELNSVEISNFNLTPYMLLAKYAYENALEKMPAEKVLEIHSLLSTILIEKEKSGKDYSDTQHKIDACLGSIRGLINCEYIETQLMPRLESNPQDLHMAKEIFNYSLQAKCSSHGYFMKVVETISKNRPTYSLTMLLGEKWYASGDYDKAWKQFAISSTLAKNDQDIYEALISQAKTAAKLGQKSKAKSFAFEALAKKMETKEPYNLIGNLYFNSFDECAQKKEIVLDRAIFIAAYDMYKLAENVEAMAVAKAQFPSIEDIFNGNYSEGQELLVGCWINEKVLLRRR